MSLIRFFILFAQLLTTGAVCAAPVVNLLLTDQKSASVEFASEFRKALARIAPAVEVRENEVIEETSAAPQKIIVAVGSPSFQQAIQKAKRSPVIGALLPRFVYERALLQTTGTTTTSAVFLDQPEERQMAMLSLLPGPPVTVGFIRTANNVMSLSRLRSSAARYRLKIHEEVVSADYDLAAAVQNAAGQSDVILAAPDPVIFSPQTIAGILLSTYRARVPLAGFSPAYTRAGALVSLHSSIRQLAEQTAAMVRTVAAGGGLPAPQAPVEFEVSINRQVARSLGLELPAEATVTERVKALERLP